MSSVPGILGAPSHDWLAAVRPHVPSILRGRGLGNMLHLARVVSSPSARADVYWQDSTFWSSRDLISCSSSFVSPWERHPLRSSHVDLTRSAMFYDAVTYLPDDILVKVDRASMAHGLEVRSPFLDHRVVEWALSLSSAFKVRAGVDKWIVRRLLSRYVSSHLADRPKTGFSPPVLDWLRGPLREWAESLLSSAAIEAVGLRPSAVHDAWAGVFVLLPAASYQSGVFSCCSIGFVGGPDLCSLGFRALNYALASVMRIAIHLSDLAGGGAERMLVHLANEFSTRGHCVALVVDAWAGSLTGLLSSSVERVVLNDHLDPVESDCQLSLAAAVLRFSYACGRPSGRVARVARLALWLDSWRPEVLLATLVEANCRVVLARSLARFRVRTVIRQANVLVASGPFGRRCTQSYRQFLLGRVACVLADHVIAVGTDVRSQLISAYALRPAYVTVIPNPTLPSGVVPDLSAVVPHPWLAV